MEVQQTRSVLQITKSDFDAPAPVVALFNVLEGEGVWKICDEIFISVVRGFDFENPDFQVSKMAGIQEWLKVRYVLGWIHVVIHAGLRFHHICPLICKKRSVRTSNSSRSSGSSFLNEERRLFGDETDLTRNR